MPLHEMQLKIFMPFATFFDITGVLSMVAETKYGSLGILPNRQDCVAVLDSGIFSYTCVKQAEQFIALNQGVFVKTGSTVLVSTRRAVGGKSLATLHQLVVDEFQAQDEQDKSRQATMVKLETGFLRRFATFQDR